MERVETIKLFSLISNAYDMFDVTEEKVDLWDNMLRDQDFNIVLENLRNHIQREKYPPSIADLRKPLSITANSGYLDKGEVLRLTEMKEKALKYIPNDKIPEFIKKARERANNGSNE